LLDERSCPYSNKSGFSITGRERRTGTKEADRIGRLVRWKDAVVNFDRTGLWLRRRIW